MGTINSNGNGNGKSPCKIRRNVPDERKKKQGNHPEQSNSHKEKMRKIEKERTKIIQTSFPAFISIF